MRALFVCLYVVVFCWSFVFFLFCLQWVAMKGTIRPHMPSSSRYKTLHTVTDHTCRHLHVTNTCYTLLQTTHAVILTLRNLLNTVTDHTCRHPYVAKRVTHSYWPHIPSSSRYKTCYTQLHHVFVFMSWFVVVIIITIIVFVVIISLFWRKMWPPVNELLGTSQYALPVVALCRTPHISPCYPLCASVLIVSLRSVKAKNFH